MTGALLIGQMREFSAFAREQSDNLALRPTAGCMEDIVETTCVR
jgi:hypothetical protein